MSTTQEILLVTITEVNHADALSSVLKDALPPGTPQELRRNVDEIYASIGRIKQKMGDLQHSLAQSDVGSLTMPPAGFIANDYDSHV